jgi:hypothetical protein
MRWKLCSVMVFINLCEARASHQMREGMTASRRRKLKSTNQLELPQWANGFVKARLQRLSFLNYEVNSWMRLRTQLLIEVNLAVSFRIGK